MQMVTAKAIPNQEQILKVTFTWVHIYWVPFSKSNAATARKMCSLQVISLSGIWCRKYFHSLAKFQSSVQTKHLTVLLLVLMI